MGGDGVWVTLQLLADGQDRTKNARAGSMGSPCLGAAAAD